MDTRTFLPELSIEILKENIISAIRKSLDNEAFIQNKIRNIHHFLRFLFVFDE